MKIKTIILLSVFAISLFLIPPPLIAGSNDDLMQCMADCVIEEGEGSKDTCKQRCSKIHIDMGQGQKLDCMGTYKACKKTCQSDKSCKQTCKDALMNCS